ncbi:hypothetical protein [Paenibacillus sp. FSL R7-0026]|uniref:hypothetical protein n=1 Tax=Paenibacillus sp. FSL R7-0026 TaxID=2921668 RepID=UPI0030F8027E
MSRRIENDTQLAKAIQGMQRLSEEIEDFEDTPDPLNHDKHEKNRNVLIVTSKLVQEYSRGKEVQADPSRAAYYDQMGWSYQDFTAPAETPKPAPKTNTPTETKQAPEQPTEPQKTASKVSSWLDD